MQNLQKLQFLQDTFQNLMLEDFLLHFFINKREHMYIHRPIPHQQQHQSNKLDEESLRTTIQIIVFLSQYE